MRQTYEVIVVGCGGLGSAAAYWLARRIGSDVLAIEQFRLGHDRGSSQDHSRIIRRSYHDPNYTALAAPAYELVERARGRVRRSAGRQDRRAGPGTARHDRTKDLSHCAAAMTDQGIPYEELNAREIMARWPQFRLPDEARGLYQADSGLVDAAKANAVHVALARAAWGDHPRQAPGAAICGRMATRSKSSLTTASSAPDTWCWRCGAWTNNLLARSGDSLAADRHAGAGHLLRHAPHLATSRRTGSRSGSGGRRRSSTASRSTARWRPRPARMSAVRR